MVPAQGASPRDKPRIFGIPHRRWREALRLGEVAAYKVGTKKVVLFEDITRLLRERTGIGRTAA
jgi:hypothetical protein